MKTPAEIKKIRDNHTQMRENTCFQSAVEMVLKLYGAIREEEYPEQSFVELDGGGIAPFAERAQRIYDGFEATFAEEKFPEARFAADLEEAKRRGIALLAEGIYPIYSLVWPSDGYHAFVGIPHSQDKMQFITKSKMGKSYTKISNVLELWPHQVKTEILIVQKRRNPA